MSWFTSPRERRLWSWALAVVLAIYATLGLAGRLADRLQGQGLLELLFGLGFVLALAAIAASGWLARSGRYEKWARAGTAVAYLMVVVRMGVPAAERTHLFEYGLVAVLVYSALVERRRHEPGAPLPAPTTVIIVGLLGWFDEVVQGLLPSRVYDIRDVGFNALAGLMAVVASKGIAWARRVDTDRREAARRRPGPE